MQTSWILIIPFWGFLIAVLLHSDDRIAARMANIAMFEGLIIICRIHKTEHLRFKYCILLSGWLLSVTWVQSLVTGLIDGKYNKLCFIDVPLIDSRVTEWPIVGKSRKSILSGYPQCIKSNLGMNTENIYFVYDLH